MQHLFTVGRSLFSQKPKNDNSALCYFRGRNRVMPQIEPRPAIGPRPRPSHAGKFDESLPIGLLDKSHFLPLILVGRLHAIYKFIPMKVIHLFILMIALGMMGLGVLMLLVQFFSHSEGSDIGLLCCICVFGFGLVSATIISNKIT